MKYILAIGISLMLLTLVGCSDGTPKIKSKEDIVHGSMIVFNSANDGRQYTAEVTAWGDDRNGWFVLVKNQQGKQHPERIRESQIRFDS